MKEPFVSKIQFTNFKCYEHLDLDLCAGVNLIFGVNGAGKTVILEGISRAFDKYLHSISPEFFNSHPGLSPRLFTPEGMREPEFQFPVKVEALINLFGDQFELLSEWNGEFFTQQGSLQEFNAKNILGKKVSKIAQNGEKSVLPVVAFFSTERLFTFEQLNSERPTGRRLGYHNCLNPSNIQGLIRSWIKDAEYEQYQKKQTDPNFQDLGLKCIYSTLKAAFDGEWNHLYYLEPTSIWLPKGLFLVPADKSKTTIPESLLSDGYRNLVWLLLEIAWRCYILNPYLGENAAKETNGIVMIDEVDLHMHPKWQQIIIGILEKSFPKIQFVLTTHSPIVLGSAQNGQVILLENQKATVVDAPYGHKPSFILETLMGVEERLPELREDISGYFELINNEQGRSKDALKLREKLEGLISNDDPLFVEADILIRFLTPESSEA